MKMRLNTGWTLSCAILNSNLPAEVTELPYSSEKIFNTNLEAWNPYADLPPCVDVPASFWQACGEKIRNAIGELPLETAGRTAGLFGSMSSTGNEVGIYRQWDNDGAQRLGIYSRVFTYRVPRLHLSEGMSIAVRSEFPRGELCVKNGLVQTVDAFGKPTNLPPCGIIVIDCKK